MKAWMNPQLWLGDEEQEAEMETEMEVDRVSLREVVERWLMPNHAVPFRVRPLRNAVRGRCVRVDARAPCGDIVICFFQHDDGAWRVFPPLPRRLMMRAA
jgi:hypothetical protein